MRRARSKVQKNFGINRPGSEEFARLIEECTLEQEVFAAYDQRQRGKNFYKMDPEMRMEKICETLV